MEILSAIWIEATRAWPAILGFGGVVTTLIVNGRIARGAQQAQWDHEGKRLEDQQQRERISLRSALLAELKVTRRYVSGILQHLVMQESKGESGAMPVNTWDDIYRSVTPRMGLLSESEINEVVSAYGDLRYLRDFSHFYLRDFSHLNDKPAPADNSFVLIPAKDLNAAIRVLKDVQKTIDAAIDALEGASKEQ